ncbi:MAG: hypothetical protein PHF86_00290 [Candidatus Nanoarchaeia archaeon]|nr:hypothetical protein [Candidatus Nanoarchaeia archaeon]
MSKRKCPYCKKTDHIVFSIDKYICTWCGEQWKPKLKKSNKNGTF